MDVKKEKQPGTGPKDPLRKTARDGTPGPMKERAVPTAGQVVIKLVERWRRKNLRIGESDACYQVGKARVTKLVKVVTDQFELRKCHSNYRSQSKVSVERTSSRTPVAILASNGGCAVEPQ